jgi:16S rRNA (cytidine1402-2'-O)-methyltransferase
MAHGTLYVVATPLGNLADLSPRAAEVLRSVSVVAAEDTRRTRTLLSSGDGGPRLVSFHAHSEPRRLDALLDILRDGRDVAIVSDAGTPVVSDPGSDLVAAAHAAGVSVVPIPGPSAVAAALSAAGLPADRYLFLGFIPRKGVPRRRLLARAAAEEWTVVFFEAPHRIEELLADLRAECGGSRRATVARELTKLHEEIVHGTLDELAAHFSDSQPRGEFTVVLEGAGEVEKAPEETPDAAAMAAGFLADGMSRKETARRVAEATGLSRNDAYRLVTGLP